jgi:hypothetical protein
MYKTISGILTYDDSGNYVVGNVNFSSILDKIYYANNNHLDIKIYEGNKILYIENGNLYRRKADDIDIYDYHICGNNLENVLFNSVGKFVTIEFFAEAVIVREVKYAEQITTT